jgi:DNA adenine methylase
LPAHTGTPPRSKPSPRSRAERGSAAAGRVAEDDGSECRPFLKWAGGKRQLLPALLRAAPRARDCPRYFEPFLGGAALFFALRPRSAVLADTNERLIRTYRGIRDDVEGVIRILRTYRSRHGKDFFYRMRARDIDAESDAQVAAWFIYLNRVGYNGLYRVNRRDRFNVPFGRYENPTICDAPRLRAASRALEGVDLRVGDFCDGVRDAGPGDFVYFDPPYVPLTTTASFTSYTAAGFGHTDQVRLRDLALRLKAMGVHVLVSNSGTAEVRELYADGFVVDVVRARRAVNSRASGRGAVQELVIR